MSKSKKNPKNTRKKARKERVESIVWSIIGILALVGLFVAAILLLSPDDDHDHAPSTPETPTEHLAADFSVTDAQGKEVLLSELRGKPVVVNFWATWCPYCLEEMPDFEEAYKKYGRDVTFLMVNATTTQGETKEKAAAYIEEQGYTFPVCYDLAGKATSAHKITSYPTTLFIDKSGALVLKKTGMLTASELEEGIQKIK